MTNLRRVGNRAENRRERAEEHSRLGRVAKDAPIVHFSEDCGVELAGKPMQIETAPYSGGYGLRGAVEMTNGRLIMPLNDIPDYQRIFVVISEDRGTELGRADLRGMVGRSPVHRAGPHGLDNDELLMLAFATTGPGHLFSAMSEDGGASWTRARARHRFRAIRHNC